MRPIMSVVIILLLVAEVSAIEPVSNIIEQTNAPIQVMSYYSLYRERAKYTTEGIHHTVEYKNVTDKTIVAVSIGLVSFSVWNEFMDHTNGMAIRDISPGLPDKGVWIARAYAYFSFLTGFAYVSKVRFSDGIIWEADIRDVLSELVSVHKDPISDL